MKFWKFNILTGMDQIKYIKKELKKLQKLDRFLN